MAGYSRDDFDVPVEDYNFEEITDVKSLIDQMGKAGGFTAAKLSRARDILSDTIGKSDQKGVLNCLSFPACLQLQHAYIRAQCDQTSCGTGSRRRSRRRRSRGGKG